MPRPQRIKDAGVSQHVTIRGNNKAPIFFGDADREFFLRCLHNAAAAADCGIHAYVLMTNHVHLLATPRVEGALSRLMQDLGRRYVENINLVHGRTGTLLEGRFKSRPVLTLPHALNCLRYIEQNPARAGMVRRPSEYPWSSCRHHVGAITDGAICEHAAYLSLGESRQERAVAYAQLCVRLLQQDVLGALRAPPSRGRPRKTIAEGLALSP